MQVHRDIMDGRYLSDPFDKAPASAWVSPGARVEDGAIIEAPCFIDHGGVVKAGSRIAPYSVVGHECHIEEQSVIDQAILWANTSVRQEAGVRRSTFRRQCHTGRSASIENGVVLGDKSVITDYSKL